jgi:hypothetical protein
MVTKPTDAIGPAAALNMQKELFDTYGQVGRAWLARVQSEVDLWTKLAAKLAATRSVPEAMGAYQECMVQQMQMIAEDGRRLSENCQEIVNKITRSLSNVGGT